MISFRIKGCAVRFYFSFFVFNAMVFILRDSRLMLAFYTACAVHESGHILAVLCCGGHIRAVELSGAGIRMIMRKGGIVPVRSSLFVLLAGPAANIIVFLTVKLAGCNGAFPLLELTAAVYNMLPYNSLDGGAVIALLTAGKAYEHAADIILTAVRLIIVIFAAAAVCLCGSAAVPLLIASAALFIVDIRR